MRGVFGKHPLRESVEVESATPCRSAREERIGGELHQYRGRVGRPIAVEVLPHASDVHHGVPGGEAVQHDSSHLGIVRLTHRQHDRKARRLRTRLDRLPGSAHTGQSALVSDENAAVIVRPWYRQFYLRRGDADWSSDQVSEAATPAAWK